MIYSKRVFLCLVLACSASLPLHAQAPGETQVSTVGFGDVEFDWGRDGVNCPTCNFGQGNSRFNWTDRSYNLWVGHVDPTTGLFNPPEGNNELVDTRAYFWATWGNGPEWAFSTQNGQVVSQLVFSRYPNSKNPPRIADAAFATQSATGWKAQVFPGATTSGSNSASTILPEASQCNTDPVALAIYHNLADPLQYVTENVSSARGTVPSAPTIFGSYANGIGERFVPCTHQLLFQGLATYKNTSIQQVFWYDIDTGALEQLTTDPTAKFAGFMFQAPDFGDSYIFFTVSGRQTIQVFQQMSVGDNGEPIFSLVNTITSPDPNAPYINTPEPFINCTPTCATYVFFTLSSTPTSQQDHTIPNGLGVAALSKANGLVKELVAPTQAPASQRLDPEYFITANGPYLYYSLGTVQSGSKPYHNLGEYYIDMGLGAPSGPCVGSSAQDGLLSGC